MVDNAVSAHVADRALVSFFQDNRDLARIYARRVHSLGAANCAITFEDVVQELEIKLYEVLVSFGKKYARYLEGKTDKEPTSNVRAYCARALQNYAIDIGRRLAHENSRYVPLQPQHAQIADEDSAVQYSSTSLAVMYHGVDVTANLPGRKRIAFSLYLRGYTSVGVCRSTLTKIIRKQAQSLNQREFA